VIHPLKKGKDRKNDRKLISTWIVTVRKTARKDKSVKIQKVRPNGGQSCCRNADKVL
jgi:hypothetical protein